MILRYYLSLLSLPLVAMASIAVGTVAPGHGQHLLQAAASVALVLVVINLLGARVLFTPVGRYLDGTGGTEPAVRRIQRLPLLCAGWIFALALLHMAPLYVSHHGWPADPGRLALIVLYGAILALYAFFIIADYTAVLRERLFAEHGIVMQPGRGHILPRLLAAFAATAVAPASFMLLQAYSPAEAHAVEMAGGAELARVDAAAALVLIAAAIVFISRNFTRPVALLLASIRRVGRGDLGARAPVVSDDEVGALAVHFNTMVDGLRERELIRQSFGRFVPESVAAEVIRDRGVLEPQLCEATVLFSDIERFTAIAETLAPAEVIALLNDYFHVAAEPIRRRGGVVTQFQGDALLATFNVPVPQPDHAARAVAAALDMQRALAGARFAGGVALATRIGINTGPVVAGTVGDGQRLGYTVHGDTVNLAARLEQMNKDYGTRILVSARTAELAGGGFDFRAIGSQRVRGHARPVTVLEVRDAAGDAGDPVDRAAPAASNPGA